MHTAVLGKAAGDASGVLEALSTATATENCDYAPTAHALQEDFIEQARLSGRLHATAQLEIHGFRLTGVAFRTGACATLKGSLRTQHELTEYSTSKNMKERNTASKLPRMRKAGS